MRGRLWHAKRDPRIPKDGRCAVCGKERPMIAVIHKDPFCSTSCARAWHDQDLKGSGS